MNGRIINLPQARHEFKGRVLAVPVVDGAVHVQVALGGGIMEMHDTLLLPELVLQGSPYAGRLPEVGEAIAYRSQSGPRRGLYEMVSIRPA